ncbi:methyltransferase [Sporomusa termitida]|uniref:Mitomycin biosynthesis 6-O-methyltransferase n=1 Tax=Sporomusa termitida TaxID=2377 RepID=A0A517DRC8_9FIRM|nr:methyltransferase [Sporomusa termitida]QDR79911.1 Mitomycin biosynthesis 6-O-methyltransferase [Sporomusa termitida]
MEVQERMIIMMLQGFTTSYLICAACELELFDHLHQGEIYHGEMTVAKLSSQLAVEEELLYRLLRPLLALQLIQEADGVFFLTALGKRLSKHSENSLKDLALFCGRESMPCWAKLYEAVKLRTLPYLLVEKQPFFAAQHGDREKFSIFNSMMRNSSKNLNLSAYFAQQPDKSQINAIVDIGGGAGDIMAKFLHFYHKATGIIVDLEHVRDEAQRNLTICSINQRCRFATGNFFEKLAVQADLFILSRILHDWDDEKAGEILKNTGQAMTEDSRLLVIEKLMPDSITRDCLPLYLNDLYIWSVCGGKERTEAEFIKLFRASGLVLNKKYRLTADEYVLEVKKEYCGEEIV